MHDELQNLLICFDFQAIVVCRYYLILYWLGYSVLWPSTATPSKYQMKYGIGCSTVTVFNLAA